MSKLNVNGIHLSKHVKLELAVTEYNYCKNIFISIPSQFRTNYTFMQIILQPRSVKLPYADQYRFFTD